MYLLQRHRMPIKARFESSLVLAYALPENVLQPFLPPGLVVDTYKGFGFLAIALVHTRELRPAFVPRGLGISFFLSGYRIFTRYKTRGGETLRGLKVLRTDTNHRAMRLFGNMLTHYNYQLSSWDVRRTDQSYSIRISTRDHLADLHVEAALQGEPALPSGSPFEDFRDASRFAGPLPFTFDYERETNSIIRVEGVREQWNPRPATVTVHRCGFLEQDAFRNKGAVLANAFYVENVPYGWRRGIRERLDGPL
jgi:hypothetical protein